MMEMCKQRIGLITGCVQENKLIFDENIKFPGIHWTKKQCKNDSPCKWMKLEKQLKQYYTIIALGRDQYEVLWSRVQQY